MKEILKKNFGLIVAFLLPLVLVAGVALSIYIPRMYVKTNYNFIYATCSENSSYYYTYDCKNYLQRRFTIVENILTVNEVNYEELYPNQKVVDPNYKNMNSSARIFLHDIKNNESREISLEEAKKMKYDGLLTSPDGVTVTSNYTNSGSDFFPFGGSSSSYGYFLSKGSGKSKLNLLDNSDRYYYQSNFQFLGWVLQK